MFDADAYRAAMARPAIQIDGAVLEGRILSQDEVNAFQSDFDRWMAGEMSGEQAAQDFLRRLITALGFDPNLFFAKLPPTAIQDALIDFFLCQYRRPPRPTPATRTTETSTGGAGSPPAAAASSSSAEPSPGGP